MLTLKYHCPSNVFINYINGDPHECFNEISAFMAQGKLKLIEMTIFLTKQVYVGFTCKNLKSELGSITL